MTVHTIRGAFRSINCKGRGPETFRKVWRGGAWRWISGTLPASAFRSDDRHADTRGDVETGEIIAEFSRTLPERRCSVDQFYVVADADADKPLCRLGHAKPRIGVYAVTIDGATTELPDPLAH